jgi:methylated-DNA-[protein]-cysteine S-methyltransferase
MMATQTTTTFTFIPSPMGRLCLTRDGDTLSGLFTGTDKDTPVRTTEWVEDPSGFDEAIRQLGEYFGGTRRTFDLPLEPRQGTAFQRDVWKALTTIPYGETATYGEISRRVGRVSAVRAVGAAVGKNPWGIIVPCHRVLGANRTLTGFAGGIAKKRWLLEHEGVNVYGGSDHDDPRARIRAAKGSVLQMSFEE